VSSPLRVAIKPFAPGGVMLFADTNDILPIVYDFSIRAKNTVAQRVFVAVSYRFNDSAPRPEKTA